MAISGNFKHQSKQIKAKAATQKNKNMTKQPTKKKTKTRKLEV